MSGQPWDWVPYLVDGATRPDALSGMDGAFLDALTTMFSSAPPEIQQNLRIASGYRSPEVQASLYQDALRRYGSEAEARRWVAPPGRSQHNHGRAADLRYLNGDARAWAHANAANFGLNFPLGNEDWHIELVGARDGSVQPVAVPGPRQTGNAPAAPVAALTGNPPPASLGNLFAANALSARQSGPSFMDQLVQQTQDEQQRKLDAARRPGMLALLNNSALSRNPVR